MNGVNNHPVHITKDNGEISTSSFIPFCSFGEDMKTMGTKFGNFPHPVCNSFTKKMHHDQICYEVDLNNKFKKDEDLLRYLRVGIILTLDYNEDRQIKMNGEKNKESARIHFNSLSTNFFVATEKINFNCFIILIKF